MPAAPGRRRDASRCGARRPQRAGADAPGRCDADCPCGGSAGGGVPGVGLWVGRVLECLGLGRGVGRPPGSQVCGEVCPQLLRRRGPRSPGPRGCGQDLPPGPPPHRHQPPHAAGAPGSLPRYHRVPHPARGCVSRLTALVRTPGRGHAPVAAALRGTGPHAGGVRVEPAPPRRRGCGGPDQAGGACAGLHAVRAEQRGRRRRGQRGPRKRRCIAGVGGPGRGRRTTGGGGRPTGWPPPGPTPDERRPRGSCSVAGSHRGGFVRKGRPPGAVHVHGVQREALC
mmetsp:Transcript_10056/g.25616  ORF Transcript_10056/g.25616 Transcript_10056/m.25616 type:complete len:283 (-) Transcript_10056:425-1273(-)